MNSKGTYTVYMKKRGSLLQFYAKDKVGNKIGYRHVKVSKKKVLRGRHFYNHVKNQI
ncbi:hypothetical protein Bcoa_0862 [Heyndrickxia coagulans 36D1]|uniref:Uncharacterized protein n=1 Tax=Heyndrickxia coagulans 36D1 TaxID=345219 RepID=G2TR04_HEYCO|nr:hypothetical protein Bcoa_0862 [Heyndrickxia coagulans 36D1]